VHTDPRLVIQIFQLLWSIYSTRRSQKKPSDDAKTHDEPAVAAEVLNRDKLQEVIQEVTEQPEGIEQGISAVIDKKFPPAEAQQVKDDFATFAFLASPPDFADYDFAGIIAKYVKAIQAIALKYRQSLCCMYGRLVIEQTTAAPGSYEASPRKVRSLMICSLTRCQKKPD
jgi:hypothetical protein